MTDEKYSLWLVAGAALLVDNALTLQGRQDILDSMLYAQLRANKRVQDRSSDHAGWFGLHRRTLGEVGWLRLREHQERECSSTPLPVSFEPMRKWLCKGDETLAPHLDSLSHALAVASARKHLARFVKEPGALHELGVVSRAQVLTLCSQNILASQPTSTAEAASFCCELRGWAGTLNESLFALKRAELRALIESRSTDDCITYVGKLAQGGVHGQA